MKGVYQKFWIPFSKYYLIRWKPRALTPIHGHDGKDCVFMVLNGRLKENVYTRLSTGYFMKRSKVIEANDISFINDSHGEHTIQNIEHKATWSLHRYT